MHGLRPRAQCRKVVAFAVFLLFICCSSPLSAQSKFAGRLPANTIVYLEWRGSGAVLSNAAKNHLLQLALDPKFAPVWASLTQSIRAQQSKPGLELEFTDVISLLSNPLVVGATELPAKPAAFAPVKQQAQHMATFLVYDATGKAELVRKLRGVNSQAGAWSSYDFRGTQVESRTVGTETTYRAQAASYYLLSDQKQVIEDLVGRFGGTEQPASSLMQVPQYQEARKHIDADAVMEFFFCLPDFTKWAAAPGPKGAFQPQMLAGLHLEKVHAAGGSLSFVGEATEMRGAILGDTSAGGLFDLMGESRPTFVTEPLAGMGSSFSASRINWAAGYKLLWEAFAGNLTPQQAASVTMGEAMAQSFLGMPIEDALRLFTGEITSVTSYSKDGKAQDLYAVTIQKREAVLRILRAVVGHMIVAEDSAGATTYLDVTYPYRDPVSGTQRRKFYYVAVTPDMILVAPRKAMLRQAASLLASPAGATAGTLGNPAYQQMRTRLPQNLTALSAADLTQVPWDKLAANLETQLEQSAKKQNGAAPQAASWLKLIPPDVVPRHLKVFVGGSWKDANGFYIESYIQ